MLDLGGSHWPQVLIICSELQCFRRAKLFFRYLKIGGLRCLASKLGRGSLRDTVHQFRERFMRIAHHIRSNALDEPRVA